MKKLIYLSKPTLIILMLLMVSMFTFSTNVFAYESTDIVQNAELITSNDSNYSRALETLNLTEEEIEEDNIQIYDISLDRTSIPADGNRHYFSWFSFADSNGGAYWTCTGNYLKWGFDWYGTYDSNYDLRLGVYLYKYPGGASNEVNHVWKYNGEHYDSPWMSAVQNLDYRFYYYCSYLSAPGTGYATVHMYVACKL